MNIIKLSASLILLSFTLALSAQNVTETRSYFRSVPASGETTLELSNRFGSIHLTSWRKDSISIKTEIEAYGTNEEYFRKIFDGITINMSETSQLVRVETHFEQNISMLFESFKGITDRFIDYSSGVEINYYITIPEYLDLRIENRYGDVFMENCSGNFTATLTNGDFRAGSLEEECSLTLSFCNASVRSLASGKIDASFSEISIEKCGNLRVNSLSSRFDLTETESLNAESRRDKFYINTISSLSGNSYFTDFSIEEMLTGADINTRYGNFSIERISPRFGNINIISSYADVTLTYDPDAAFSLEIEYMNANVNLPGRNIKSRKEALNEERREYFISATIGRNPGSRKTAINATRGNIYIRQPGLNL